MYDFKILKIADIDIPAYAQHIHPNVLEGFMKSISKCGVVMPIYVTKKKDRYIVVDGKCRFAAAKALGHTEINCVEVPEGW